MKSRDRDEFGRATHWLAMYRVSKRRSTPLKVQKLLFDRPVDPILHAMSFTPSSWAAVRVGSETGSRLLAHWNACAATHSPLQPIRKMSSLSHPSK